jgi:hypothetical protein
MKFAIFMISAAAALASAPAMADNGQVFDYAAQAHAYASARPSDTAKRCFNGKFIAGVNRSGQDTLYVQSPQGGIYRLRLTENCDALDSAQKLTVRANGSDVVCPGDDAQAIAKTAAGDRLCRIDSVRRLTPGEIGALATAARR